MYIYINIYIHIYIHIWINNYIGFTILILILMMLMLTYSSPWTRQRHHHQNRLIHYHGHPHGAAHNCVTCTQTIYMQRGHEHTRTWNWSESGFGSLRGAPLNISKCLGGSRGRDPMAALCAGPPPPVCRWGRRPCTHHVLFTHAFEIASLGVKCTVIAPTDPSPSHCRRRTS